MKPEETGEVGGFDVKLDAKLEAVQDFLDPLKTTSSYRRKASVEALRCAVEAVAEARRRLRLLMLPGFVCSACGVFTGDCKERQAACRCCGLARRGGTILMSAAVGYEVRGPMAEYPGLGASDAPVFPRPLPAATSTVPDAAAEAAVQAFIDHHPDEPEAFKRAALAATSIASDDEVLVAHARNTGVETAASVRATKRLAQHCGSIACDSLPTCQCSCSKCEEPYGLADNRRLQEQGVLTKKR